LTNQSIVSTFAVGRPVPAPTEKNKSAYRKEEKRST